jgi:predicted transglutaminase-like cysteine proteinase
MRVRERRRAFARAGIVLMAVWAELSLGAAVGRPDHVAPEAAALQPSLAAPQPTIVRPSQSDEPFNLPVSDEPGAYAVKWRAIAAALEHDRAILAACRARPDGCAVAAQRFAAFIETARVKEGRARLGEINRAINLAIRYESDIAQHGAADAWASPLATLSSGRGDCEDYAIAKYLALRELGVPPGDVRVVIVRDTKLRRDHAVVAARLEDRWVVLDNRTLVLVDDHNTRDYVAVTAFGSNKEPLVVAADRREGAQDPALAADAAPSNPDPS